jgi:hypothetical protein
MPKHPEQSKKFEGCHAFCRRHVRIPRFGRHGMQRAISTIVASSVSGGSLSAMNSVAGKR